MSEKLNINLTILAYVLSFVGLIALVLVFNIKGGNLPDNFSQDFFMNVYVSISFVVMILIPISIIINVVYLLRKRIRRNLLSLIFSILSLSYIISFGYFLIFVFRTLN